MRIRGVGCRALGFRALGFRVRRSAGAGFVAWGLGLGIYVVMLWGPILPGMKDDLAGVDYKG